MKKIIKTLVIFTLIMLSTILINNLVVYASVKIPEEITINTGYQKLGSEDYKNFKLNVHKITSNAGIGYCLEVYKEYPKGQTFKLSGQCDENIRNMLIAGYPNKSAAELGVKNDANAYLATQIAIWAKIEGFDIESITTENEDIVNATKKIYYSNSQITNSLNYEAKVYYDNEKTQDVVMLFTTSKTLPQTGSISNIFGFISGLFSIALGTYLLNNKKI